MSWAEMAFAVGTLLLTVLGVVVAIVTAFAVYLTYRGQEWVREVRNSLDRLTELQKKVNYTLIMASDFAVARLPEVSLSQQIPAEAMGDLGIIEDIFTADDGSGEDVWAAISTNRRVARLAYARAVFKIGSAPISKLQLVGLSGRENHQSAITLLEVAQSAAEKSDRDPLSLKRDILIRKVQVLRQAEDFGKALDATKDLDIMGSAQGDKAAAFFGPLCRALIGLQQGLSPKCDAASRLKAFATAAQELEDCFADAFDRKRPLVRSTRSRVTAYEEESPGIDLGSVAYYYAKSLAGAHFAEQSKETRRQLSEPLWRALDMSLLFFERTRREKKEPRADCVYEFCVALIAAICLAPSARPEQLHESFEEYPDIADWAGLKDHATARLDAATTKWEELKKDTSRPGSEYIYLESAEKLEKLDRFRRDIDLVRRCIDHPERLRTFFVGG